MKSLSVRYEDDIVELRQECNQLQIDLKAIHVERDDLQNDIDYKQSLIQKFELDMQQQIDIVAHLNKEVLIFLFKFYDSIMIIQILGYQQDLVKERETISRLQSNDLSLERLEKLQETIHELKSEITQLKQEKFAQIDQLQQVQERSNQLDIDNNELTIKMKQLKDLLEQRDQTIARIRGKMLNDDDEETTGYISFCSNFYLRVI